MMPDTRTPHQGDLFDLFLRPRSAAITCPVCRGFTPVGEWLPTPETAAEGDVFGMVAGYTASLETGAGITRVLDGFYRQTVVGPAFRTRAALAGTPAGAVADRLAMEQLYLAPDIHQLVCNAGMTPSTEAYEVKAVTFADARVLFWAGMVTDPRTHDPEAWEMHPCLKPLLVAVPDWLDAAAKRDLAARRVALVRRMLPEGVDFDVEITDYAPA